MADNFAFTEGSGKTGAADDIGGVLYPRVKIAQGADGSATDVSSAAPLQVSLANHAANATAVKVDGSAATQPVSHAALTELAAAIDTEMQVDVVGALPAGDNNIGNVDIASAIPAGTNNIGDVDIASITTGDNVIGRVKLTDGTEVASVDASNRLEVAVGNTVTVASHAVTNAGTFPVQVDGSALTALQKIDDPVLVDDAAFTPATSSVMMAGFEADEGSTDSVDEGDAGAARMTLDRKIIVTPQPHTAGGLSIFRSIDLDEGTLEVVKNAPGCVYGMWVTNTATSTRFVKFYDATSGTAGTGTPVITVGIPGNSSDDVTGLFGMGMGIMFATGICVGAVTGVADNDTGAPGANEIIINVFYK